MNFVLTANAEAAIDNVLSVSLTRVLLRPALVMVAVVTSAPRLISEQLRAAADDDEMANMRGALDMFMAGPGRRAVGGDGELDLEHPIVQQLTHAFLGRGRGRGRPQRDRGDAAQRTREQRVARQLAASLVAAPTALPTVSSSSPSSSSTMMVATEATAGGPRISNQPIVDEYTTASTKTTTTATATASTSSTSTAKSLSSTSAAAHADTTRHAMRTAATRFGVDKTLDAARSFAKLADALLDNEVQLVESPHPYLPGSDEECVVSFPGATLLTITFDERCK